MESWGGVVVQRGCAVQHPGADVLSGAEAALSTFPRPPLPPPSAIRLLPPVIRLHHHPCEPSCFTSAVYQHATLK